VTDRDKRRYVRQGSECLVDDCTREPAGLGYCLKHYKAFRRHGTPTPRYRGVIINGKRICATCQRDMPAESFRYAKCVDCWAEENRRRQHARRAGDAGERFTRREVLERDEFVCGICLKKIDDALAHPDPWSASLDHVIPLSRGGAHTMANAQAAHLDCNRRKAARMPEPVVVSCG
jgi:5-methylcytosine-specific restriction endonuclease McrA